MSDPRPKRIGKGWLERDGRLLSASAMTFRLVLFVVSMAMVSVLKTPDWGQWMAISMLYIGIEYQGVVLGRVIDNLLDIEVERRWAIKQGFTPRDDWGRGG